MTPEQMKQMQLMNSPGFRAAVQLSSRPGEDGSTDDGPKLDATKS